MLHFQVEQSITESKRRQEVKAGTWKQELEQGSRRDAALLLWDFYPATCIIF